MTTVAHASEQETVSVPESNFIELVFIFAAGKSIYRYIAVF